MKRYILGFNSNLRKSKINEQMSSLLKPNRLKRKKGKHIIIKIHIFIEKFFMNKLIKQNIKLDHSILIKRDL